MRSHTVVHLPTTNFFVKPFVLKNEIEKEGLARDGPAGLGAGGRRFESGRPDDFSPMSQAAQSLFRLSQS